MLKNFRQVRLPSFPMRPSTISQPTTSSITAYLSHLSADIIDAAEPNVRSTNHATEASSRYTCARCGKASGVLVGDARVHDKELWIECMIRRVAVEFGNDMGK
jgi:transposase-like protein